MWRAGPALSKGGPAPPTEENIAAVMELYSVGERFFQEFTLGQVLLNAAKNGCGPSAAGTSSRAEGPNTAEPAEMTACHAPEANRELTAGSAPIESMPAIMSTRPGTCCSLARASCGSRRPLLG
jgi:hypothetical protein